jgi:hypothetical protein
MDSTSAALVDGGIQYRGKNNRMEHRMPGIRFTNRPRLALLALLLPGSILAGAEREAILDSSPSPKLVLARFLAAPASNRDRKGSCAVAIDIDASLPKQSKQGRLQAIRHFGPFGKSEYQVLRIEGDRTVKQQLIARYLSAEAQAEALPASSTAITEANYKFRYVGSIGAGPELAYVFQISPRRKRVGLFKGELWIEAGSGIAVHQAGRMVRTPSIFLRQIDIVRDVETREGRPEVQITRLNIDARLLGRAELTIRERPCAQESDSVIAAAARVDIGQACSTDASSGL